MSTTPIRLLDDAQAARVALSPIRSRILEHLREPGSASSLAANLGLPRQKVGYHLKALEEAGLVTLHDERARRGFTERRFVAGADAFIIDPALIGAPETPPAVDAQDRHAAEHLVATAAGMVRDVARMREAAGAGGKRLLTFTVETEIAFARPADLETFTDRLAEAVAALVREFDAPDGGRRYRIVAGGHPAPHDKPKTPIN